MLALIASLIARVENNFAILTTIIRHLKRRLKMPCLGPVHTYLVKTVPENAAFQKRSSEWRFLKTPASHFRVDGPKRRFSCSMMSYILLALCMFRKRWYAFSFGRAKTIRIRSGVFVWMDSPNRIHHTEFVSTPNMKYAVHELIGICVDVA